MNADIYVVDGKGLNTTNQNIPIDGGSLAKVKQFSK